MIGIHPYIIVFMCVIVNVVSQILLKAGMNGIGHFEFDSQNLMMAGWKVITNPYVMGGLALYGLSFLLWLMALSRLEVSLAYPLLSIGYILTPFISYFLLQEAFSPLRIVGICIIMIGVFIVARS